MFRTVFIFMYLVLMSISDIKERRVSVLLLIVGSVLVGVNLTHELLAEQMGWLQPILGSLPGIFLLAVAWLSRKAGYADGIVLLWLGVMCGYRGGLFILCVSLLLISAVSVTLLILRRVKRETRLPYIPFLAAGFLILSFIG